MTDVARRCEDAGALDWPALVVHHGDLLEVVLGWLLTVGDLTGWVVYLDPPYMNCTGYAAECERARVLAIARLLSDAGALVCISEAEPLSELGETWDHLDITHARVGQAWGGRRVKSEWLTCNRSMRGRVSVPVQMGLGLGRERRAAGVA